MKTLTTKNFVKVRFNQATKVITLTTQLFNTKAEGIKTLGVSKTFDIMNLKGLNKASNEGWTVVGMVAPDEVKVAVEVKAEPEWTPKFIVGDAKIEAEIQAYTERKMKKTGVHFSKGVVVRHESFGGTDPALYGIINVPKATPIDMSKANARYSKSLKYMDKQNDEVHVQVTRRYNEVRRDV